MMLFEDFEIELVNKLKGWIKKGDQEENSFDKFISYWIAFNIIYNTYYKKKYPKRDYTKNDKYKSVQIKELLVNNINYMHSLTVQVSELIPELSHFRNEKWKRNDQKTINTILIESYNSLNYPLLIEMTLKIIYKIRCNLFHGEKDFYGVEQHQLLNVCCRILKEILIILLEHKHYIHNY